ncbi:MAG: hypothetical protein ACTHKH_09630 [Trinickia sp.]
MLSPHELTTLMLVGEAPEQIELGRTELRTLLAYELVVWESVAEGYRRPRITTQGQAILRAVGRTAAMGEGSLPPYRIGSRAGESRHRVDIQPSR